jgi:hypothetical protein
VLRDAVDNADNETGEVAAARAANNGAAATLAEVKTEFAALTVPPSKSARDLADAYQRFLAGQEESLGKEHRQILALLETKGAPPPTRRSQINALRKQALDREAAALVELRDLQAAFTRENDIVVKSGK